MLIRFMCAVLVALMSAPAFALVAGRNAEGCDASRTNCALSQASCGMLSADSAQGLKMNKKHDKSKHEKKAKKVKVPKIKKIKVPKLKKIKLPKVKKEKKHKALKVKKEKKPKAHKYGRNKKH